MGFCSLLKSSIRLGVEAFVLILLITFIPGLPPDVSISEPYKITKATLEGKFAPNNKLDNIEFLYKDQIHGPESFADDSGFIYTSLHLGDIVKLVGKHHIPIVKFGKPCTGVYQEEICGRPLGIRFGSDGYLYIADSYYGIFKVDVKTGDKTKLIAFGQEIDGRKTKLPNSVAVACNGDIYWTDTSTDFTLQDGGFIILADPSGRLIHYNAKTKENKVLIDKIHFANGAILSQNEDFVLVSETARSRIHRYYLKGPKKGTSEIFLDGLPGLPDNIQSDGGSGYIVGLVAEAHSGRPHVGQVFSQFPNVRKFFARTLALIQLAFKTINKIYPNEFAEKGVHFVGHLEPFSKGLGGKGGVLHVSESGEVLDFLWSSNKTIGHFSEGHIVKDHLYLGSPFNKYLGRISLSNIGWEHLKPKSDSLTAAKQKCLVREVKPKVETTTRSEAPKAATRPTTTTPRPTTTTPRPTTTTPRPTTTTSTSAPTTTQKPTTSAPRSTKSTTATPKPTPDASKSIPATPKSTGSAPKPGHSTPKPTKSSKPVASAPKPVQAETLKESTPPIEKPKVISTTHRPPKSEELPKTNAQHKVKSDSKETRTNIPKNEL